MAKNKYLGGRVRDVGRKGLSSVREFNSIIKAIMQDYFAGKINKRTAKGRLLLLYRLSYKKNNSNINFSYATGEKIRKKIKKYMRAL